MDTITIPSEHVADFYADAVGELEFRADQVAEAKRMGPAALVDQEEQRLAAAEALVAASRTTAPLRLAASETVRLTLASSLLRRVDQLIEQCERPGMPHARAALDDVAQSLDLLDNAGGLLPSDQNGEGA